MVNCTIPWDTFQGDIPDSLLHFFIFYCYAVSSVGLICNVVALWCVVSCPRTRPAVKVLLCALFSSTLLMCVLVMPFMAYVGLSKVRCSVYLPTPLTEGMVLLYIVLTEMELLFIVVMAFLRTVAVWSPQRHQVKLRTSLALVAGVALYATVTTLVVFWRGINIVTKLSARIYNCLNFLAPVVLTLACYLSMIVAVRYNKSRVASSNHAALTGKVMDQATRAMLAVFISNLLLGLPHSIYHILPVDFSIIPYVIVHIIFYAHLIVDPLAFLCSNHHHRQRLLQAVTSCLNVIPCRSRPPSHATSTLPLHITPQTSSQQLQEKHGGDPS
ncbi:G-protein coupled receptor 35-like [Portunus trituberculatus]|uniref:G-protein coupled receptor 35-like n=1 Tax=Portunus trituberculatus TaxID=210409 RepID=UPI001E1D03BE|nr:G-protein coupled receptor 35-like [Portunus trituberculatus]